MKQREVGLFRAIGLKILLGALLCYRWLVSPMIQSLFQIHCRYEESCSCYFERKVREEGFVRGTWLGFQRFLSCNPWQKVRRVDG